MISNQHTQTADLYVSFQTFGVFEMPALLAKRIKQFFEIQGEGQPLVMIHGGFVDNRMWNPQIEYFSKRFRVIRYDLHGHWQTCATQATKYAIDLFADDLKALLDELRLDKDSFAIFLWVR
jgi:pimeloyl-ACP methyl ester carboxylesterase